MMMFHGKIDSNKFLRSTVLLVLDKYYFELWYCDICGCNETLFTPSNTETNSSGCSFSGKLLS